MNTLLAPAIPNSHTAHYNSVEAAIADYANGERDCPAFLRPTGFNEARSLALGHLVIRRHHDWRKHTTGWHDFVVFCLRPATPDELTGVQIDAGFHPAGYTCSQPTERRIGDLFIYHWSCADNCD